MFASLPLQREGTADARTDADSGAQVRRGAVAGTVSTQYGHTLSSHITASRTARWLTWAYWCGWCVVRREELRVLTHTLRAIAHHNGCSLMFTSNQHKEHLNKTVSTTHTAHTYTHVRAPFAHHTAVTATFCLLWPSHWCSSVPVSATTCSV